MKLAIASDHAGFALKEAIKDMLADEYDLLDLGTDNATDSVDYPDFGYKMAGAITSGLADKGILVCGTGIGISMAANRNAAVRAALCTDVTMARLTREHNDANVLCLGARITGPETALDIVRTFLSTPFGEGRHVKRVEKLKSLP